MTENATARADGAAAGAPLRDLDTVGVVAVNGTGYLRAMLSNLTEGRVSVPLRNAGDTERLARTGTRRVVTPEPGSGWIRDTFASVPGDAPAQISFSSGTEGAPKAVLLSRGNLHDVVTRLNATMAVTDGIREYVGVPVHHSFGYGRARAVLAAGGALYVPEAGFDLGAVRAMLERGEINALSAVPSQWRVFLANLDLFGSELERVRWVEIGSQFMSAEEKRALRRALPNARIVQHYGLTEASRTTLLSIHDAPDTMLGSVGRAVGDVGLRTSPDGRIAIRGPHVALGIDDGVCWRPLGPGAWLETTDLGRIEDGWLWFEGRADDVINSAGIKLSPDLAEAHVRAHVPDAGDFGLLRRPDPVRGEGILVALGPDAGRRRDAIVAAVADYARAQGLDAAGAIATAETGPLPRTDTGKLRRKALAETIETVSDAGKNAPQADPPAGTGFAATIAAILGPRATDPGKSFADLGGDSLLHMQVTLALERALGAPPPQWETLPLADLAALADAAEVAGAPARRGAAPLPRGDRNMNPEGIGFRTLVAEDYRTNDSSVFHQGFLMLLVHRFGNWRMDVRPRLLRAPLTLLYRVLNKLTQILFGMKLDYTVKVGRRVKLEHFGGMILGAREIGNDVILRQNTTMGIRSTDDLNAKPVIGDFVDVGAGAVIVGDITVGENSVIGANSVVYMNVPPDSVVVGVPGRVIGKNPRRNPSPLRERGR